MADREEKAVEKVTKEGSGGDGDENVPTSAIDTLMADREEKAVEKVTKEGSGGNGDDNVPISSIDTLMADREEKAVEKVTKEGSGGDGDDNIPISAIDRGKKKLEDSDVKEVPIAESNKVGETGNAIPSQVKKEESSKGDLKKKGENSKGKEKLDTKSSSGKAIREKKVKKVYDLPGQKHDPPEERDPSRRFYESLHIQRPESEMAKTWMMERGLLQEDEAKEVFEKKKQKGKSPAKSRVARKSVPAANTSVKRSLGSTKNPEDNSAAKSKKHKAGSDSEDEQ